MSWADIKVITETDEQMDKVIKKLEKILMEDEDVYDFYITDRFN